MKFTKRQISSIIARSSVADFHNASEAANLLDGKKEYKYISRYINKNKLVKSGSNLLYFVMHPEYKNNLALRRKPLSSRNTKSIILIDTLEKTSINFKTVKDLLIHIGHKTPKATSFVKRYMNPSKIYKNRYFFVYEEDFKGNLDFFFSSAKGKNIKKIYKELKFQRLNQSSILCERSGTFFGHVNATDKLFYAK